MKINAHGKLWKNASDEERIAYCEELLTDAKSSRRKKDFEWYLNKMFVDGQHYAAYNTVTNSIERPPRKRGEVRIVVNKVKSAKRAICNYSTRHHPKWSPVPGDLDEETITNARRSGKFLDYIYRKLHLETMVSGVVDEALDTSVAWVEVDWDDKADDGLGEVKIKSHDSFDIWCDSQAEMYAGKVVGRFIAKTPKRSLDEIASDERYDKKTRTKVKEDDELAVSSLKARLIRKREGAGDKKIKRATVKEFFLWEDEPNEKEGNIRLFTYSGSHVLREKALDKKEYPLYLLQIPLDPLRIYHRSWVADSIPLNKALDRSVSQKIMYVNQALVYRIIAEVGHGVKTFTNENGEIIEINKGRKFEQMTPYPLPQTVDSLSSQLASYIEDDMGSHDAALGRLPAGARSGKTLEALQAADSNNLAGIRMALESFLAVLGKAILEIVAEKYVASRVIQITEPENVEGEKVSNLRVIGGKSGSKRKGATIITGEDELIVKIGSWLGYTQEAQRETLFKLGETGVIPAEEVLRQFEFPNIEELSKKAREERLEQSAIDAEIAGRNQQGGQGGQAGGQAGGIDMAALADKENTQMMNGEPLPPTEGADMIHHQAHRDFVQTNTFAQAQDEIKQIIIQHIQGEAQMLGLGGGM